MSHITLLLSGLSAGAWAVLIGWYWQMNHLPMSEMWMPPNALWQWQFADFLMVWGMWALMMAAMMLPSLIGMASAFTKCSERIYGTSFPYVYLFCLGYFLIWLLFSVLLTVLQWLCHGLGWLSMMMDNTQPWMAAGVLILAGVYQWSSLKDACLSHCRSPLGFLMNSWQAGRQGAWKLGLIHGSHCLGCCWAQMALMFVVGVMNVWAMALITLAILLEKNLSDRSLWMSRASGFLLIGWGMGLILKSSL